LRFSICLTGLGTSNPVWEGSPTEVVWG